MNTASAKQPNFSPAILRRRILNMAYDGSSVHVACAFSLVEIFSVLYSRILRYNPLSPIDENRDLLILSKGHGVMAHYACYGELGWLQETEFKNYFSDGSNLHGLCEFKTPGFEVASGSLGHGLPIAVGMAYGLKLRGSDRKVVCIVGDGEMNEGPMWESLLFAAHHNLSNLIVIVDANGFQAMGTCSEVINLEPLADKFRSFGFQTDECDGHDLEVLYDKIGKLWQVQESPQAIIARTVKGQGVSFMRANNSWHYSRLTPELLEKALQELSEVRS